ncbi:MAG: alpha/beta fold hydrolase [Halobacteriales archaeon]
MKDSEPIPGGWESGRVETNEVDTHYVRTGGDDPPLVIAHGVYDDGLCRLPLARDLDDDHDVILYDARGHGRSDAPEGGYDSGTRAQDLIGLLDALDVEDPYLFGHSMGGDTVAAAAARRPDLPRAVALVEPAGLMYRNQDADDVGTTPQEAAERIAWWHDHTKAELLEEDDELRGYVANGRAELARLLADARLRVSPNVSAVFEADLGDPDELFPAIEAPTLVLRADVGSAARERDHDLVDPLPNVWLVRVDGAGHCVFRDEREAATRELRGFLEGT